MDKEFTVNYIEVKFLKSTINEKDLDLLASYGKTTGIRKDNIVRITFTNRKDFKEAYDKLLYTFKDREIIIDKFSEHKSTKIFCK